MDINSIIQLSNESDHQNLIAFLSDRLNDENQQLFARSFYMTFFNKDNPYPIDCGDVVTWLGYSRKDKLKRQIDKYLVEDVDYKVFPLEGANPALGGRPSENIKMTIDAFKKLGMLAGTDQGAKIRMYYIELEKHLISYGLSQAMSQIKQKEEIIQQKTIENQVLEKENENLRNNSDGTPIIYIFDTDARAFIQGPKELKIGITEHYSKRSKPFKSIAPHGRMIFNMEVPLTNLKMAEKWIHTLLAPYNTQNEIFRMDPEEARMWITREINSLRLANNPNWSDKFAKLSKLIEMEKKILYDEEISVCTREISAQTDDLSSLPIDNNGEKTKFDQFIEECCIINESSQVSTTDIVGQYRIWAKSADKQTYHAMLEYLKKRFMSVRMRVQDKDTVINGYGGVELKKISVKLSCNPTEVERFVYANFNYSPSGKVLMVDVIKDYEQWKKTAGGICNNNDIKELKEFLKNNPHVLISNLWTENGNGQGYYGISPKSQSNYHRKTSATAKKIEKRDKDNNFLKAWTTIAKAAEDEGVGATTMSRFVKNKKVMDDGSYYISV
jgi:phage anti-repressor protein